MMNSYTLMLLMTVAIFVGFPFTIYGSYRKRWTIHDVKKICEYHGKTHGNNSGVWEYACLLTNQKYNKNFPRDVSDQLSNEINSRKTQSPLTSFQKFIFDIHVEERSGRCLVDILNVIHDYCNLEKCCVTSKLYNMILFGEQCVKDNVVVKSLLEKLCNVCETSLSNSERHRKNCFKTIENEIDACPIHNKCSAENIKCIKHVMNNDCNSGSASTLLNDFMADCKMGCSFPTVKSKVSEINRGQVTTWQKFPWIVSIYNSPPDGNLMCVGALLSRSWIITSAYCLDRVPRSDMRIRVYSSEYFNDYYEVGYAAHHPNYTSGQTRYDIALLKLSKKVNYDTYIRPVCLPNSKEIIADDAILHVAGWYDTLSLKNTEATRNKQLRETTVRFIDNKECFKKFNRRNRRIDIDASLCTMSSGPDDKIRACKRDEGSPLIFKRENLLLGVASHVSYCVRKDEPSIYTDVTDVISWIKHKIDD